MANSSIAGTLVPTGGVISLAIISSGTAMTLSRSTTGSGGTFTQIYSGVPTPVYIDCGDGTPTPLSSGLTYTYQLTDANGTTYSTDFTPVPQLNIQLEPLNQIMFKTLQAGINNILPPQGITPIPASQVMQAMPLTGLPNLPIVTLNLDLMQQAEIPIGQNSEWCSNIDGTWTINGFAKRMWRVSVLATNIKDRDFYGMCVVAIFESMMRSIFAPIGQDIRHSYQVANGQVAKDPNGQAPGFYYAEILCEVSGVLNVTVSPNYGFIETIDFTAEVGGGATVSVTVTGV